MDTNILTQKDLVSLELDRDLSNKNNEQSLISGKRIEQLEELYIYHATFLDCNFLGNISDVRFIHCTFKHVRFCYMNLARVIFSRSSEIIDSIFIDGTILNSDFSARMQFVRIKMDVENVYGIPCVYRVGSRLDDLRAHYEWEKGSKEKTIILETGCFRGTYQRFMEANKNKHYEARNNIYLQNLYAARLLKLMLKNQQM